jgi:hypothetical protein
MRPLLLRYTLFYFRRRSSIATWNYPTMYSTWTRVYKSGNKENKIEDKKETIYICLPCSSPATTGSIFIICVTSNYTPRLISSFSQLHHLRGFTTLLLALSGWLAFSTPTTLLAFYCSPLFFHYIIFVALPTLLLASQWLALCSSNALPALHFSPLLSYRHCFTYSLTPSIQVNILMFVNCVTGVAFLASPTSIVPSLLTYSLTHFIEVLRFIFATCITTVTFLVSFPTPLYCSPLLSSIRRLRYSLIILP